MPTISGDQRYSIGLQFDITTGLWISGNSCAGATGHGNTGPDTLRNCWPGKEQRERKKKKINWT